MTVETGPQNIESRYQSAKVKYLVGMEKGKPHLLREAMTEIISITGDTGDLEPSFNLYADFMEYLLASRSIESQASFAIIRGRSRGRKVRISHSANFLNHRIVNSINDAASREFEIDEDGNVRAKIKGKEIIVDPKTGALIIGDATLSPEAAQRIAKRWAKIDEILKERMSEEQYAQIGEQYHRLILHLSGEFDDEEQKTEEAPMEENQLDHILRANLRPRLLLGKLSLIDSVAGFGSNGTVFSDLYSVQMDARDTLAFLLECQKAVSEDAPEAKLITHLAKRAQFRLQELINLNEDSQYANLLSNISRMNVFIYRSLMLGPNEEPVEDFLNQADQATIEGIGKSFGLLSEQIFGPANYVSVRNGAGFENHSIPLAHKAVEDFSIPVLEKKQVSPELVSPGIAILAEYLAGNYDEATETDKWLWTLAPPDSTSYFPTSPDAKREALVKVELLKQKVRRLKQTLPQNITFAIEDRIFDIKSFGSESGSITIDILASKTEGQEAEVKISKGKHSFNVSMDKSLRIQIPPSVRTLVPLHSLDLERQILSSYLELLPKAQIEEPHRVVPIQSPSRKRGKHSEPENDQEPLTDQALPLGENGRTIEYTARFDKSLEKLSTVDAQLVMRRLQKVEQGELVPSYLSKSPHLIGYHYIRAGNCRVIMLRVGNSYVVETVDHRDTIYKQN